MLCPLSYRRTLSTFNYGMIAAWAAGRTGNSDKTESCRYVRGGVSEGIRTLDLQGHNLAP